VSRLVIENAILPRFKANDFAGGISRGVDDLIQVMEGDPDFVQRAQKQEQAQRESSDGVGLHLIIALFVGFWILRMMFGGRGGGRGGGGRRGRRGGFPIFLPIPGGFGGGRGGGFGGGGFGGGGFGGGGFGGGFGGGGGSFGGGGSSGSW
jgi:uncharacterized protein